MAIEIFLEGLLPDTAVYLQLARFFATFFIGVLFIKLVLIPMTSRAAKKRNADKKSRHSIQNFVGVISLFLVFIVSLQAANFGGLTTVIGAIAAAVTVAVGFGMRDQVSNVVAGIFIHLDNPFVKNDYIRVNDIEGVVMDIKLHATVLNGNIDEKTVVPNNVLTQNPVKNFTRGDRTKTVIQVKVAPPKVEETSEILRDIAQKNDRVRKNPSPNVDMKGYEDDKAVVQAEYWIKDSENVSEVRDQIMKTFNERAADTIFNKSEE